MEAQSKSRNKNKYGQYFTPPDIAEFMVNLYSGTKNSKVLEPSCGKGIFLEVLEKKGFSNISAFEIDSTLSNDFSNVRYESFVSAVIEDKFDLIIGNPPYIRWKNLEQELKDELSINDLWNKYFNALCDYLYIFILKSIELLEENGQLIFICPEYWLNTTHSVGLREYMVEHGYFEEIYHFNETPIFENATVSVIVFRYIKSKKKSAAIKVAKFHANKKLNFEILQKLKNNIDLANAEYIDVSHFNSNERWILETDAIREELKKLEDACKISKIDAHLHDRFDVSCTYDTIGDICDIGNGLVSGLDKAFQINKSELSDFENSATIDVIKAKNLVPYFSNIVTKYIFLPQGISENDLKTNFPNFYDELQPNKLKLQDRYQYNREINYWDWVFLRNYALFSKKVKKVFVPCKERISNKNHFRFSLVNESVYPTQDVTAIYKKDNVKESIEYITSFLNSPIVFDWIKCNGIVKGNIVEFSEKPISIIPFRKINWGNREEVQIHDEITMLLTKYCSNLDTQIINKIESLISKLLNIN